MSAGDSPYFTAFIYFSLFMGLCGIVSVLRQPRRAFRAAGHSKGLWLLIEMVGTLFLGGVLTWAIYSIAIRPDLVREGGRPRRQGVIRRVLAAYDPRSRNPGNQTTQPQGS